MQHKEVIITDEVALSAWCIQLSKCLQSPTIIYLKGMLGAGKTTFTRALLRAFGVTGAVRSPTYTLVEHYVLPHIAVYHYDFYRIADPEELAFIGIRDYFAHAAHHIVEWPEKAVGSLPAPDLMIKIDFIEEGRKLTLISKSALGQALVAQLD